MLHKMYNIKKETRKITRRRTGYNQRNWYTIKSQKKQCMKNQTTIKKVTSFDYSVEKGLKKHVLYKKSQC